MNGMWRRLIFRIKAGRQAQLEAVQTAWIFRYALSYNTQKKHITWI